MHIIPNRIYFENVGMAFIVCLMPIRKVENASQTYDRLLCTAVLWRV